MYDRFKQDINDMNQRYELEPIKDDVDAVKKRLSQFSDILDKEFTELEDIRQKMPDMEKLQQPREYGCFSDVQTDLADLLGDIIVYCASEAARWNIPLDRVLEIIMASNTSKLGADGKPIKNPDNGKFEKGPNYWKPEPLIKHILDGGNVQFVREEGGTIAATAITAATAAKGE